MRFIVLTQLSNGHWIVQTSSGLEEVAASLARYYVSIGISTMVVDSEEDRAYRVVSPDPIKEN